MAKRIRSNPTAPCPHCGTVMEIGDEFPEERICDACAAVKIQQLPCFTVEVFNPGAKRWEDGPSFATLEEAVEERVRAIMAHEEIGRDIRIVNRAGEVVSFDPERHCQIMKIASTAQCFDGLALQGFNHYTDEPFYWLMEGKRVASNAQFDWSNAEVLDQKAAEVCKRYGMQTKGA